LFYIPDLVVTHLLSPSFFFCSSSPSDEVWQGEQLSSSSSSSSRGPSRGGGEEKAGHQQGARRQDNKHPQKLTHSRSNTYRSQTKGGTLPMVSRFSSRRRGYA